MPYPDLSPQPRPRRIEALLERLLARVSNTTTAAQAATHARAIYPAGQPRELYHRSRFLVRTLCFLSASVAWFAFLDDDDSRRSLVKVQPTLAEKIHRPYLRSDFDAHQRLQHLTGHLRAIEDAGWADLVVGLGNAPLPIASVSGKSDEPHRLLLATAHQFDKEGGLCLHLVRGDTRLYTAAFSFVSMGTADDGRTIHALDIGCLQGPTGPSAADEVRQTTKALHGLRPRDLMTEALRGVARAGGAEQLVGVSNGRHIYRHWRKRRDFAFDYDGCWVDQHGVLRADGDYRLDLETTWRPIEQVPSNKRAAAQRKRRLVADLQDQIVATLAALARRDGDGPPAPDQAATTAFATTGLPDLAVRCSARTPRGSFFASASGPPDPRVL